jgi:hypothetical protein
MRISKDVPGGANVNADWSILRGLAEARRLGMRFGVRQYIVAQSRGKVEGRDAERGPELDDRPRARASRQHVEQRARLSRDGEWKMLHASVKVAIVGLAPHQARPLFVRKIGDSGSRVRQRSIRLFEQAIEQGRERGGGERGHGEIQFGVE